MKKLSSIIEELNRASSSEVMEGKEYECDDGNDSEEDDDDGNDSEDDDDATMVGTLSYRVLTYPRNPRGEEEVDRRRPPHPHVGRDNNTWSDE